MSPTTRGWVLPVLRILRVLPVLRILPTGGTGRAGETRVADEHANLGGHAAARPVEISATN